MMIRKALIYLNLFIFFLVSVGINIFSHSCKEDGTSISYVFPAADHCAMEVETAPCCRKEALKVDGQANQSQLKEDCCSDQFSYIKLYSDQVQDHSKQVKSSHTLSVFFEGTVLVASSAPFRKSELFSFQSPPPKSGREILIAYQNFRI